MAAFKPVALYGLEVVANDEPVHAFNGSDFPATFRITMAALDPTAPPSGDGPFRATLKMIRLPSDDEDDSDDDEDDEYSNLDDLLDDDESSDDEDVKGGPSDPSKSKKARKAAALDKLRKALLNGADGDEDEDMDVGTAVKIDKGKGKAAPDASEEDDDDDDLDSDDLESEEFIICTLDTDRHYQQTLDITINEHEEVLFQVTGTHNIHLTGNILFPDEEAGAGRYGDDDDEDEEDDLDYGEDELELLDGDLEDEDDELDDLDDPRIQEIDEDEEEIPKLIAAAAASKKNKKRAAEEDVDDEAAATNGIADEPKLTKNQLKKQRKKQKDNAGNAVEVTKVEAETNGAKSAVKKDDASPEKGEKKVQFAEKLVQGPSNGQAKKEPASRVVQGVTIEDKKIGSGPQAKNGDKISMRYIGKLDKNKKVFDSNKKGAPFTFKLGAGQVIKGWDIGVAGMATGGERRITIPAHLAYGSKGAKPDIPPNAVLQFDLKVLDVRK